MKKITFFITTIVIITSLSCSFQKHNETDCFASDWSNDSAWYQSVKDTNNTIDIFYIASTEVVSATDEQGKLSYRSLLTKEDVEAIKQEYAFVDKNISQGDFNFYAPYYHQFTFDALNLTTDSFNIVYNKVASEVIEAFDYYIEHINHGRQFCIMGFSQGAMFTIDILKHMKPETYKKMIATYTIGYRISKEDCSYQYVIPAKGEKDTGVTISFNSCMNNEAAWQLLSADAITSINPVNWKTDATPAQFIFNDKVHEATLDTTTHLLIINTDDSTKEEYRKWMQNPVYQSANVNQECLHHWDILFYTKQIHDNIISRSGKK